MRLGLAARTVIVLALLHVHFHHRFHGPPFDYVGLAVGSAVSSAGFPGPGETLLVAAGILAAANKLDLASVVIVAFVGATVGGIVGWLIGLKVGRTVLEAPGPFRRWRRRTLARGERIFNRYPAFAVLMTPAWVSGVHRVRSKVYQPLNALGGAIWAAGVGVGAYFAGPPIVEVVGDVGLASLGIVGAVILGGILIGLVRHRRGQQRATAPDG